MNIADKLAKLRKENNYTQEELADLLGVSRQSVSKWESGVAYPETEKLVRLGELYGCSMDYLLKDEVTDKSGGAGAKEFAVSFSFKEWHFERKSKKTLFGLPLWHINIGWGRSAKGVFALGLVSKGLVSVGLLSLGVVSFGVLALGLLAFGAFALGLLSVGSIGVGVISVGAISIGVFAVGALSVGCYSVGALAVGRYAAIGDHARAMVAIGQTKAVGSTYSWTGALETLGAQERAEIGALVDNAAPWFFRWAATLFKLFL